MQNFTLPTALNLSLLCETDMSLPIKLQMKMETSRRRVFAETEGFIILETYCEQSSQSILR